MKLVGTNRMAGNNLFRKITIRWPAGSKMPVIAGQWRTLPDGRIQADYSPQQLSTCLAIYEWLKQEEAGKGSGS